MATTARGEGVWLLPASRWAEYKLPPQMLQRGVNHQQEFVLEPEEAKVVDALREIRLDDVRARVS
jgi:hypothetical protein